MSRVAPRAVALAVCAVAVTIASGRAIAHTELDFSLPANGTTVGEPVDEISVGFTDLVALVGNGFEVHDPQGNLLTPFIVTDDNKVFRFQLDPPLAGGLVVVDYHVRALDGDVQEGSFSFTVAAPLPPSTTEAPTTAAPTTVASPATAASAPAITTTTQPAAAEPATTAPGTTVASALPTDDSDSDGDRERSLMLVVLLAIAAAAGGFLVVRSRRPA